MQKEQSVQDILSDTDQETHNRKKLYLAMVLDQSGSMSRGARETIDGFNEQIQSVRAGLDDQLDVEVIYTTFACKAEIKLLIDENIQKVSNIGKTMTFMCETKN